MSWVKPSNYDCFKYFGVLHSPPLKNKIRPRIQIKFKDYLVLRTGAGNASS